jgi:putative tryptophan/tyrosine transport system substrate-binding protein
MRRRAFITLLGGAATAWPFAARVQQLASPIARVGVVGPSLDNPQFAATFPAFPAELRKLGFTEGQNLALEYRAIDQGEQATFAGAAELVRWKADLLVASGPEISLKAALAASSSIPIVFTANNYDPIARGYVESVARPGGNITGVFYRQPELASKQLELLADAFPGRTRVAALWDSYSADQFGAADRTAKAMRLELSSHKLENPPYDFLAAFRDVAKAGGEMLLVLSSPLFTPDRMRIAELAIQHRLPTMFIFKTYVEAGGLMSYGVDTVPLWRRAASYVAKILRGAKPSELPVEQATNFEFALNLKTARAIGVTLPTSILLRADEVIE